ncbi:unnamed protein product [Caenorhabditis bovis]|uniref:Uncharacterized protein n=1 Tax=Caenorhabditis bovis TaxID=2654633 RepID=A0A8S1EGB7_9PELO|nr:unnamed protein product [Caenorhabditis bovis]
MRSMAELAGELSTMAGANIANNERDIQKSVAPPKQDFNLNAKPSQMIGGALSNLAYQSRNSFIETLDKIEKSQKGNISTPTSPDAEAPQLNGEVSGRDILGVQDYKKHRQSKTIRYAEASPSVDESQTPQAAEVNPVPSAAAASSVSASAAAAEASEGTAPVARQGNALENNPFMAIAKRFLQMGTGNNGGNNEPLPQLGIRDFVSGSDNNFGLPHGKGCLPFISEFMQIAYGNCQDVADEKTFDAWGDELRRAILHGEIDLLKASQETCRRGAERQQCDALRDAVANCDVMASLEIGSQLQRAMKRCEDISGIIDQNPAAVLGQLNNLISGEVAQGFLNNFLKNG